MNKLLKRYLLPIFVGAVYIFLYTPIIVMMVFSLNQSSLGYRWTGLTFDWYYEVFHSTEILTVLVNSLIVAGATVLLSVTMGTALCWALYRKFNKLFYTFYSSLIIPEIIIAVGLLSLFVLLSVPLGLTTLIVGHTLLGLGFVLPILYVRFAELDYRLIEASLDLGANLFQTFFKVVLPFLMPAIVSAAMLVFIISMDDFLISFFCSSSSSQTLSLYIYSTIRTGASPVINALSTTMFLVSTVLVLIFIFISVRFMQVHDED